MPRPKTKDELLHLAQTNFDKLFEFIDAFSKVEQEKNFPMGTLNRNIRDVLAHLHHWHIMMHGWHVAGLRGEQPEIPAKGYTWKTTPELNKQIWKLYSKTELKEAKRKVKSSHKKTMQLIEKHTNEQLFEKKRYKWTGSTSLGAYLVSCTSSHYDWAYKLIRKAKK